MGPFSSLGKLWAGNGVSHPLVVLGGGAIRACIQPEEKCLPRLSHCGAVRHLSSLVAGRGREDPAQGREDPMAGWSLFPCPEEVSSGAVAHGRG